MQNDEQVDMVKQIDEKKKALDASEERLKENIKKASTATGGLSDAAKQELEAELASLRTVKMEQEKNSQSSSTGLENTLST